MSEEIAGYHERADDLENALNKGALWAVTYGDLMSFLMIFFLALFAIYMGKDGAAAARGARLEKGLTDLQKAFGGKIDPERMERVKRFEEEEAFAYKLKETKEASDLSQFVQIQSDEENVRLVLPESISFESGQADLKQRAQPLLATLAQLVKDLPNDIVVEGHTDSRPISTAQFPNNFFLSASRAHNVMEFLVRNGVDRKRLSGLGYGENRPAADNATNEGRAQNRRVEIVLVRSR
ncbi:MAG: OmpA/MotB family protein [Elusimicrobiota bacterium]